MRRHTSHTERACRSTCGKASSHSLSRIQAIWLTPVREQHTHRVREGAVHPCAVQPRCGVCQVRPVQRVLMHPRCQPPASLTLRCAVIVCRWRWRTFRRWSVCRWLGQRASPWLFGSNVLRPVNTAPKSGVDHLTFKFDPRFPAEKQYTQATEIDKTWLNSMDIPVVISFNKRSSDDNNQQSPIVSRTTCDACHEACECLLSGF